MTFDVIETSGVSHLINVRFHFGGDNRISDSDWHDGYLETLILRIDLQKGGYKRDKK